MRRLAFLIALPLIGLAGFGLSFWSPNAAHAKPQPQPDQRQAERSLRADQACDQALDSTSLAKRERPAR